ncbi:hypothetical protein AB0O47_39310 [Streptomyces noursei]|uniref:hypothetical protein n=1 Tax=Streptomyces noursei TaxID=1971 RepID=UPI00344CE7E6
MSLTRELANPHSPITRFLNAHLPGGAANDAYLKAARNLTRTIRPPEVRNVPWTTLGTAIDLRIRMWLGAQVHHGVKAGINHLRAPAGFVPATPGHAAKYTPHLNAAKAGEHLLQLLRRPGPRDPTPADEEHLARLAIVAARYEHIFRTAEIPLHHQRAVSHFTELRLGADPRYSLRRLTSEIPRTYAVDVCQQLDAAKKPLAALKGRPLTCGPLFAGSQDVGHAEGDFIAGGVLVDCKATITPAHYPRQSLAWLQQLAAYLLLDYPDHYRIHEVGLYLSRQGALISWPVPEFLSLLGARQSLPDLRRHLRVYLGTAFYRR